jgi:hypothetical protein
MPRISTCRTYHYAWLICRKQAVQCAYIYETRVHNKSSKHNSCRVNLQHSESVLIKSNSVCLYLSELENYNRCLDDRNILYTLENYD